MSRDVKDTQPTELAGAVNLFAHPVAGAAAWSAFGFGLASHAFGVWMGALMGAGNAAQRLLADAKSDVTATGKAEAGASTKAAAPSRRQSPARLRVVATQAAPVERPAVSAATAPAVQAVDDLKAIAGIGPKLEQVLNGLGVRSYAQIAAWTGEDIARIEDTLGLEGRIARDDWMGQAAALAKAEARH